MGVKISQLPQITDVTKLLGTDLIPIVDTQTQGTKKITLSLLRQDIERQLSTVAISGSYNDLSNKPVQYVLPTAATNTLGGVKIGANLEIGLDGTLNATSGFQQINVGATALTQTTSALSFFAGGGMTLIADPATNSITFSSTGGGGGGSGNVGQGTTGTLAVYFNTTTITGTNISFDGSILDIGTAYLNAPGAVIGKLTATTVTAIGDIAIAPTGNVSVSNKRILNLATPQSSNDGANKAYVDGQKAFGKILVGGQGLVTASSNTDSITFLAGNNVTLTTNPTNRAVTIAVNNTLSFALLPASTTTIGGVIIGQGLNIDQDGVLSNTAIVSVNTATTTTAGTVIVGSGLTISSAGTLTALAQALTTATANTLGGVKIGPGIIITQDGTIQVPSQILTSATNFLLGGVKIGAGIAAAVDGTISVSVSGIPVATSSSTGIVKPGYGLSVDGTGAINLGVNGNFTVTGNLSVNGVISATSIVTTGTGITLISSASDLQLSATGQVTATAPFVSTTATASTSPTTGALVLLGTNAGLGVAGNIYTGGDAYINGVRVGAGSGNQPGNVVLGGSGALGNNGSARYITAIGGGALALTSGESNVGVGYYAGAGLQAGTFNTLVGNNAGSLLTSGQYNIAIGYQAQAGQGGSANNVVIGANVLGNSSAAVSNNVLIGYNVQNQTSRSGANTIAIGPNALGNATGTNLIMIGSGAGSGLTSATNQVIIGGYSGASINSAVYNGYITLADGAGNLRAQWTGQGNLTHPGAMTITNANPSTDYYTGALVVAGGVGIQGTLNAVAINAPTILSGGSQVVTFANLGTQVSSVSAGADMSVSTTTGAVTINNTATLQSITNRGLTTTNYINITNANASNGSTSGALTVSGGVGVGGNIFVGGKVDAVQGVWDNGNRAVSLINWTGSGVSITATNYLGTYYATITNIGVTNLSVYSALDGGGVTGLVVNASTGTVQIRSVDTIDSVAKRMMAVAGQATISSISQLTMTNQLTILNTVTSTGTAYGALSVAGGMGVGGDVYIGGSLIVNGLPVSGGTSFNGGTLTGKMYVQNTSTSTVLKTNNAIATDGGIWASYFFLNGYPLSTSTVWNGGTVTLPTTFSNTSPAVSTASAALVVTGGIGTRDYVWAKGFKDQAGRPIGQGPTVSVIQSSTQIMSTSSAWNVVQFTSVNWDTDTNLSLSQLKPGQSGYYIVSAGVRLPTTNGTGFAQLAIFKNGAVYRTGQSIPNSTTVGHQLTVSALIDCYVPGSDYFDIRLWHSTGGAITLPNVNAGGSIGSTTTFFQSVYIRPWTTGPQ